MLDTFSWWPYYSRLVSGMPDKCTTAWDTDLAQDGTDSASGAQDHEQASKDCGLPSTSTRAGCSLTEAHEH